jgi:hypothetical protein
MFLHGLAELGNIEGATVIRWKAIGKALESDFIGRLGIQALVVEICVKEGHENISRD